MESVVRRIEALSLWSGRIASWLTLIGVLILSYEVFGRYFFGYSWVLAHEVTTKLLGVMYVLTGAFAHLYGDHVGVDVFYSRASPRGKAILDLLMGVIFIAFVGGLLIYSWEFFYDSYSRRQFSLENPGLPIYPFKFFIPLGAGLLLLQGIAQMLRQIAVLRGEAWALAAHSDGNKSADGPSGTGTAADVSADGAPRQA